MNQLTAMQIFARIAEVGSFTRAADALGLPKASASQAVQQLENQFGTQLLHRTTRKVELTQDGRACYERCRDLLADMEELQSMFRREPLELRGRLRVDMPSSLARTTVIPHLPQFLARHPQLEIELGSTDRRVDLVREGFDCVVRVGALGDANLVARPLGLLRTINCASPAYLKRFGVPRSLDDLKQHRLVHYAPIFGGKPFGWEYPDGKGGYGTLEMEGALTVNNADAYEAACIAGLGLIQAPMLGMEDYLERGELVEVLPKLRPEPMPLTLIYANRRNLPRRVRAFMDWMEELLRPLL